MDEERYIVVELCLMMSQSFDRFVRCYFSWKREQVILEVSAVFAVTVCNSFCFIVVFAATTGLSSRVTFRNFT